MSVAPGRVIEWVERGVKNVIVFFFGCLLEPNVGFIYLGVRQIHQLQDEAIIDRFLSEPLKTKAHLKKRKTQCGIVKF